MWNYSPCSCALQLRWCILLSVCIYRIHPACLSAVIWTKNNRWANGNNYRLGKCWILRWVDILCQIYPCFLVSFTKSWSADWQFLTFCCLSGHLADILQEAHVPIISDAVCNAPDYYDNQITTTMFCAGYEKGGTDACQVRLCLFLVHNSSVLSFIYVCFHFCISMDGPTCSICDSRETAAGLLLQRTACRRTVVIACWEWWAGERAAPWPKNPASTPKCPDFFPGYLQLWGWETPFVICSLFSIKPGKDLGVTDVFLFFSVTNRTITTHQGFTNWPGREIRHEYLSRPCRGQKDFLMRMKIVRHRSLL